MPDLFFSRRRTYLADSGSRPGSHRAVARLATLPLPRLRSSFPRSPANTEGFLGCSLQQLRHGDVERLGDSLKHPDRRVILAGLDLVDVFAGDLGALRYLGLT